MPRAARRKSESNIYHAILRGINKQQIFEDDEDYENFLQILFECQKISKFKLYAYCLMGNHIHLLIKVVDEPIEQVFKRLGSKFVYWYNIKYQRTGHLFQDRFKSEPVETENYLLTVIRYIHQNPIKSGLCNKIEEWKYSSYNDYIKHKDVIDYNFIFELVNENFFYEFNCQPVLEKCLEITDKPLLRLTDEQAKKVIKKYSGCTSVANFQTLSQTEKEKSIIKIHSKGVSIRQIVRLTGTTKGMVEKWLR